MAATANCQHRLCQFRVRESFTCGPLSRPGARTVQIVIFRSVLTGFQLYLPLPLTASCKLRKVACLLQIALEISPGEPPLFQARELFSPNARGTLQILPMELLPTSIVMLLPARNVQQKLCNPVDFRGCHFPKIKHESHPERSDAAREAHGITESKDPYSLL